jgi:hypothetical protein
MFKEGICFDGGRCYCDYYNLSLDWIEGYVCHWRYHSFVVFVFFDYICKKQFSVYSNWHFFRMCSISYVSSLVLYVHCASHMCWAYFEFPLLILMARLFSLHQIANVCAVCSRYLGGSAFIPISMQSMQDMRFSWQWLWRMPSSGMLRHVVLVRTDVSEERGASIIRVTIIGELGTMLAVTSNQHMLQTNTVYTLY